MECELSLAGSADTQDLARVAAGTLAEPWSEVGLREALEQDGCHAVTAREVGGRVRGFVLGRRVGESQVLLVAVEPEWQGRGLGTHLLGDYLARAREEGVRTATLEVRSSNASALALYESLGFAIQGQRPGFYADGEDALLMGAVL